MLDKPLFGNTEQRAFLARSRAFVHFSLSDDVTIGLTFNAWVRVDDVDYLGVMAVMTDGMRRFGQPELRMGPASPDLREELTALLNGVAFRIWSDLLARANDTPKAAGLVHLPRFLSVPAEMAIHRRDLGRPESWRHLRHHRPAFRSDTKRGFGGGG